MRSNIADLRRARVDLRPVIYSLGHLNPDPQALHDAFADATTERDVRSIVALIDWSKVVERAALNCRHLDAPTPWALKVRTLLDEAAERRLLKRKTRAEQIPSVVRSIVCHGGKVIKGLSLESYYADPSLRHRGDVDAFFDSAENAFAFSKAMFSNGDGWRWDTSELPWVKWDGRQLYGQLKLRTRLTADVSSGIDVHFGAFSVGHSGVMRLAQWQRGSVLGVPVEVPTSGMALATLVAHAAGDAYVSMKDINDLVQIAKHDAVDYEEVRSWTRSVGVDRVLDKLIAEASALYPAEVQSKDHACPPQRRFIAMLWASPTERALTVARVAARERATMATRWPRVTSLLAAVSAFRYFTAHLSVRRRLARVDPRFLRPSRSTCWRLIPQEVWKQLSPPGAPEPKLMGAQRRTETTELVQGVVLLRTRCTTLVLHAGEILLPTVSGRLSRSVLATAVLASRSVLIATHESETDD